MKQTQLSIDVTEQFLKDGAVYINARVRRFVEKAFPRPTTRRFLAPWAFDGVFLVEGDAAPDDGIALRLDLGASPVWQGDRIVLVASVEELSHDDPPAGHATLFDGTALFALHLLERVDPLTNERIASIPIPSDSAEVTEAHDREAWQTLRNEILTVLVEQEVRGPASIHALQKYMQRQNVELALLNDEEEPVPAGAFLGEVRSARTRTARRRTNAISEPRAPGKRDRPDYVPRVDARELLRLLDLVEDTFGELGDDLRSDKVAELLEAVTELRVAQPVLVRS